ncbi:MAG: hypothetical protein KDA87_26545, partial [Planctomycetales bacterium]|nr:hypothetical protein [Planctomycetales bacterium]
MRQLFEQRLRLHPRSGAAAKRSVSVLKRSEHRFVLFETLSFIRLPRSVVASIAVRSLAMKPGQTEQLH